jgi:hypothetical protein
MTEAANDLAYAKRIGITFLLSFVLFTATSLIIGEERKSRWFTNRKKAYFFNRRSYLRESLRFGRPSTVEGWLVFAFLFCGTLSFGYWYILS